MSLDPIKQRMAKGRRIAQIVTLAVVVIVGLTAIIYPEIFRSELNQPSAEERAKAQKESLRKSKKPQRRLSKRDIERLAKLRNERARKHMLEILRRLEKRVIIAEKEEAVMTQKFRDRPDTLETLPGLAKKQVVEAHENYRSYVSNKMKLDFNNREVLSGLNNAFLMLAYDRVEIRAGITKVFDEMDKLSATTETIPKIVMRKLKSAETNLVAFEKEDKDMAVRGYAAPEDHPLSVAERKQFNATINQLEMAGLHLLSQQLAEYYKNLIGDTEAGKLAEVAKISFPEALDQLVHEAYDKDDMQDALSDLAPKSVDELAEMTSNLSEAERSAGRALTESGGEVPDKDGDGKEGEGEGEGSGKDGDGDGEGLAEGNDGKGGGGLGILKGPSQKGPQTSLGQRSKDDVLKSLAFESSLGATQDMSQKIEVDSEQVLANIIPGRRYSKNSLRKGYLYIDTWHIIGPWDADKTNYGDIKFDKIYPPETKLDLDARYTSGKTSRFYDDERGYGGQGSLSGRLQWQFYQSPTVEVRIPRAQLANDALYFAYTEVYFEQATEMNLAIASDDAARIRINGEIVFQDTGLSPYVISEQVRQVKFKQGVNKILVRLVNGTGPSRFSLLLLPSTK